MMAARKRSKGWWKYITNREAPPLEGKKEWDIAQPIVMCWVASIGLESIPGETRVFFDIDWLVPGEGPRGGWYGRSGIFRR